MNQRILAIFLSLLLSISTCISHAHHAVTGGDHQIGGIFWRHNHGGCEHLSKKRYPLFGCTQDTATVAVENNAAQLIPLMVTLAGYLMIEGDGDPRKGLQKIADGEDTASKLLKTIKDSSLGQAVQEGRAEVFHAAYENFPEAIDRLNRIVAGAHDSLSAVVTYLDTQTGKVTSRLWNHLDKDTQKQILGGLKLLSMMPGPGTLGKIPVTLTLSKDIKLLQEASAAATKEAEKTRKFTESLSAEEANRRYLEKKPNDRAPYAKGTCAREFVLDSDHTFVRVHGEKNQAREWMMRSEEFGHFRREAEGSGIQLPKLLKERFALPKEPTHISDVHVPAGSRMRVGEAATQSDWGTGGGTQYELINNSTESVIYNNTRQILNSME